MIVTGLSWLAAGMLLLTSGGLLLRREWRWQVGLLAAQYLSAAWLVGQHGSLGLAAAKLVAGWMATATLAITFSEPTLSAGGEEPTESGGPAEENGAFRLSLIGMILILTASAAPRLENTFPGMGLPVASGGIGLCGLGLLQISTNSQVTPVILGLLTILTGFEILYAAVESSVLVAALLAAIHLGLALVAAYLLTFREAR